MEVLQWLHKMLGGSSPQTGYVGSLTIIVSVMELLQQSLATDGVPKSMTGWIVLIMGIGLRLAKDANKTNSQHPLADAATVPAVTVQK